MKKGRILFVILMTGYLIDAKSQRNFSIEEMKTYFDAGAQYKFNIFEDSSYPNYVDVFSFSNIEKGKCGQVAYIRSQNKMTGQQSELFELKNGKTYENIYLNSSGNFLFGIRYERSINKNIPASHNITNYLVVKNISNATKFYIKYQPINSKDDSILKIEHVIKTNLNDEFICFWDCGATANMVSLNGKLLQIGDFNSSVLEGKMFLDFLNAVGNSVFTHSNYFAFDNQSCGFYFTQLIDAVVMKN